MQFLYPNVLFLLLLLAVLIFLISTNKDTFQRFFNKDILNKLTVNTKYMATTTRNILLFISLILFVIALARPVMNMKEQDLKQNLIPIVVALDVSKSMMATDIYPNRISLAKKKLKSIIGMSKNTTIGIVLFAQNSYIVSPITEDFTSLNYIVDNLDTSLNFINGSNIFSVLEATEQMLENYNAKNLIILSDGGNDSEYKDALEFAKENKITIYTIGMATKQGAPIPVQNNSYLTDKDGNIVTVTLNESIKNLALKSGGGYIDFSLNKNDVEAIINQIQKQSKKEEFKSQKIKTYTELFYYPLGVALFSLLIAFSSLPKFKKVRQTTIVILLSLFYLYPQESMAEVLGDFKILKTAKQEYKNKEYKKAISSYQKIKSSNERNYNLANSFYKDENYKQAIKLYEKIITKDKELEYKKLHNMGNSHVKNNNLQKAKELYEKALKLKDDKQTKENLEAVNKALEKQKSKDDNKDSKDNKDNKKKDQDKKQNNKNDKKEKDNKNKDKKDNKKSDDKKKKDQDKKEKQSNDDKKNKNKDEKSKENEKKQASSKQSKSAIEEEISNMEEKKWMKSLQNKKSPIMLQKVKSGKNRESNINIDQPW